MIHGTPASGGGRISAVEAADPIHPSRTPSSPPHGVSKSSIPITESTFHGMKFRVDLRIGLLLIQNDLTKLNKNVKTDHNQIEKLKNLIHLKKTKKT